MAKPELPQPPYTFTVPLDAESVSRWDFSTPIGELLQAPKFWTLLRLELAEIRRGAKDAGDDPLPPAAMRAWVEKSGDTAALANHLKSGGAVDGELRELLVSILSGATAIRPGYVRPRDWVKRADLEAMNKYWRQEIGSHPCWFLLVLFACRYPRRFPENSIESRHAVRYLTRHIYGLTESQYDAIWTPRKRERRVKMEKISRGNSKV